MNEQIARNEPKKPTVLRVPFACTNLPSDERNLDRSLKMHSSKSTVFPLPVGAETTMFTSDRKQAGKHSLCRELKYLPPYRIAVCLHNLPKI